VRFTARTNRPAGAHQPRGRRQHGASRRLRIRLGAASATVSALAAAAALTVAAPASASTGGAVPTAAHAPANIALLALHPMPVGTVDWGRESGGQLTVHAAVYGLTPGSSHEVILVIPGSFRVVTFSTLTANSAGQANSTLVSSYTGSVPRGSRVVIRMGTSRGPVATEPIALTRQLRHPWAWPHRLTAVEVSSRGVSYGTPRGEAAVVYNARRHTLTVVISASGVTPGEHAAHIHLGSCQSQGPVLYMINDLIANRHGQIRHVVRVFKNVTMPIPANGWYLNIHQGTSDQILHNGQPTIYFRPLICANIRPGAVS
jgi:CHRD domain